MESYAIVRPPPSMSQDPRNLQVQLVAPRSTTSASARPSREFSRVDSTLSPDTPSTSADGGSFDAVADAAVGRLTRSISAGSVHSSRSSRSVSSNIGSTASGTAGTRRCIPMYNLAFHKVVLSTFVTDAGTDAKVAKFLKRGVDLLDLAILDPVDISSDVKPVVPPKAPVETNTTQQEGGFFNKFKKLTIKNSPSFSSGLLKTSDSTNSITSIDGQPIAELLSPDDERLDAPRAKGVSKAYRWTIRKWTRVDLTGCNSSSVRLEWRRSDRKSARQRAMTLDVPARKSLEATGDRPRSAASARTTETDRSRSPAFDASSSQSHDSVPYPETLQSHVRLSHEGEKEDEDEEEPDPEDDERAWVCEIVQDDRRACLGTLTPAPHHPKLVAHLAVPATLVPFAVVLSSPSAAAAARGIKESDSRAKSDKGNKKEATLLSVDELRDLVCVTCLWLIVRERLGGLARRKGDRRPGPRKVVPVAVRR